MSHVVKAAIDPASAPSDAADRVAIWANQFRAILPETHSEYHTRTDILDEPIADEFRYRFDIRDDVDAIVSALVDELGADVDWMRVEVQQDDREWREAAFRDDPDYYDPSRSEGHRTPPSLDRGGLFEVETGDAAYLIDGTEYSATATTFEPARPDEEPRTDLIVAGDAGEIARLEDTSPGSCPADVVCIGLIEVHPGKVVIIDEEEVDVQTTDWSVAHESGAVPDDV
ncbi:hypothetical protein SAMN05192561_11263 [Halopenitus malekzadehii]|uniref:Uncharacterized protein n=1 Tax=Halopenitus malekzadehii TaxID=1267564 RepID=A0A1H6JPM5_9EURY|nr:hypothetical protein [Halopenitus malekzadehii]SEH61012.1 hypothetical protein SAMN05192561_11263 [Halopenitus malekzadehii]